MLSHRGNVPREQLYRQRQGEHLDVVELPISEVADVNSIPIDCSGRTALYAAAGEGHLDVVKHLISEIAEVNVIPAKYSGRTALPAAGEMVSGC